MRTVSVFLLLSVRSLLSSLAHRVACVSGGFLVCFSFVVRKVRVTAAQKLSRGRNRYRFLFRPRLRFRAAEYLTLPTTKEKTHQKARQLCRLRTALTNAPSSRADQTEPFQIKSQWWPPYVKEHQVTDT